MKKLIFIPLLFTLLISYGQKHDAFWALGNGVLIEFDTIGINCNENVTLNSQYNGISYSGFDGELWFYGNGNTFYYPSGDTIFDANLEIGSNIGVTGGGFWQHNLILPLPDNSNEAIIINKSDDEIGIPGILRYSIYSKLIDVPIGNIDIERREVLFFEGDMNHGIYSTKHANGRDWWLYTHDYKSYYYPGDLKTNKFIRFLITADSIYGPYFQSIGSLDYDGQSAGQCIFNMNGDKFVWSTPYLIEIFLLDRCSGEFSELISFSETYFFSGKCFSPDGTKLYIGSTNTGKVYQYDLTSGTTGDEIKESRKLVYTADDEHEIGSMALGPDDKIYFTTYYPLGPETPSTEYNTYLNVIHNPNEYGAACNVEEQAVWLCEGIAQIGLPNMPNYRLGVLQGSECDTLSTAISSPPLSVENVFTVFPNPASNILQIETNAEGSNTVIIRNSNGSLCYSGNFTGSMQIPVFNFASGIYSVSIFNEESGVWFTEKWVKM